MSDPWSFDYFNPPSGSVPAPSPRQRSRRTLPDQDELFTVQRHALDVLHGIRELERKLGKNAHSVANEIAKLERDAENTYRVIRSYLQHYSQQ